MKRVTTKVAVVTGDPVKVTSKTAAKAVLRQPAAVEIRGEVIPCPPRALSYREADAWYLARGVDVELPDVPLRGRPQIAEGEATETSGVTMPATTWRLVDAARGDESRSAWVRGAVERRLREGE